MKVPGRCVLHPGRRRGRHIVVHDRRVSDYELDTGDAARSSIQHDTLRFRLIDLQPYPFSSRTMRPDEYRATFTV
jgi:hypothetical protein